MSEVDKKLDELLGTINNNIEKFKDRENIKEKEFVNDLKKSKEILIRLKKV